MGGILQPVEPPHRQTGVREMGAAVSLGHRRQPYSGEFPGIAPVELDGEIHVFVADESAPVETAALPGGQRPRAEIRLAFSVVFAHVSAAVLRENEQSDFAPLHVIVDDAVGGGAEQTFVAERDDGEGSVAPERGQQIVDVADRIISEMVVRRIEIIRDFRLDDNAAFIGRLHVFWRFRMGVMPRVVETRASCRAQVFAVEIAIRRRETGDRIRRVVAESAHEKRLAVEIELLAAHFQLAHAETFVPGHGDLSAAYEFDFRPVERRTFRSPGAEILKPETNLVESRLRPRLGDRVFDCHAQNEIIRVSGRIDSADIGADHGRTGVEIPLHPGVVDVDKRRRLQFHIAPESAPAVEARSDAAAAGDGVVGHGDDLVGAAEDDEIGHVPLQRPDRSLHPRYGAIVQKKAAHRPDSAGLQPDARPFPRRGHRDVAPVPSLAGEHVAQLLGGIVLAEIRSAVTFLAHSLSLPYSGNVDLARSPRPHFGRVSCRAMSAAVVASGEIPLSGKRDNRIRTSETLVRNGGNHRRMRGEPRPHIRYRRQNQCRQCHSIAFLFSFYLSRSPVYSLPLNTYVPFSSRFTSP